jgi:DnaJ-class molecular chaperone
MPIPTIHVTCPSCDGSGVEYLGLGQRPVACEICEGEGEVCGGCLLSLAGCECEDRKAHKKMED